MTDELRRLAARFSDDAPSVDFDLLKARYTALEAWPADAQFAVSALAWLLGPGFAIKGFKEAVNRLVPDFAAAAKAIDLQGIEGGTVAEVARRALRNADLVVRWDLGADVLYWPVELSGCPGAGIL